MNCGQLEYGPQRLKHRERNVLVLAAGRLTVVRCFDAALAGGVQALSQPDCRAYSRPQRR